MLSKKEKKLIADTDFLLTKIELIEKIHSQLEITRKEIKTVITQSSFTYSENIDINNGKIFKGENYRSLPYLVLDYPKLFSKHSTFSYRTMFWWGNFFSSTLHLEGIELEKYRKNILANFESLIEENVFISVGKTPWEYHYQESNYILLTKDNFSKINNNAFLKLSKKFSLSDFDNLPKLSASYFNFLLTVISK